MQSFSWREGSDAARVGLPEGVYAGAPVNQHEVSWCGCCYLIAVVTCLEDRAKIALLRSGKRYPGQILSLRLSHQHLMDRFQGWHAEPGWSACHGGYPLHVLKCIMEGGARCSSWKGWRSVPSCGGGAFRRRPSCRPTPFRVRDAAPERA